MCGPSLRGNFKESIYFKAVVVMFELSSGRYHNNMWKILKKVCQNGASEFSIIMETKRIIK